MLRRSCVLILGSMVMSACGLLDQASPTPTAPAIVVTLAPTAAPPTLTPVPTATAEPIATPGPAATADPSAITITDAQATQFAQQALASNPDALPVALENPSVTFTRDAVQFAGDMQGMRLEVAGTPEVVNEQLSFKLTSLKLSGLEVPLYRDEAQKVINDIFAQVLAGQRVKSVQLGDGALTVTPAG